MEITGSGKGNKIPRVVGAKLAGWVALRVDEDTNLILWVSSSGKRYNVETISPMKVVKKYTTEKEGRDYMDAEKKKAADQKLASEKEASAVAAKSGKK
jgi:hypothetical protein